MSQSECVAAAMAGGITAPLRLKDLMELDCDSCSAAGFRCYPRRLLGEPPAPAARHLLEPPPPSLSLRQRRPSKLSSLSRSLSRRLGSSGGLFWRRRGEDEDAAAAAAPSGSGSESGASLTEATTSDSSESAGRRVSRCESDSDFSTTATTSAGDEDEVIITAALSPLRSSCMLR